MKKLYLLLFSSMMFTGCMTVGQPNWVGQHLDNYVIKNGAPVSQYTLQNGSTVYSFVRSCLYETLVVSEDNIIQKQDWGNNCPVTSE